MPIYTTHRPGRIELNGYGGHNRGTRISATEIIR